MDAADKEWHRTSATPYDPPLTYGGWKQSRALGCQIGSLLQTRQESGSDFMGPGFSKGTETASFLGHDNEHTEGSKSLHRKHKIVIHSSPFLRCVQSAIAVSAGIRQVPRTTGRNNRSRPSSARHNLSLSGSPLTRPPNNAENVPPLSSLSQGSGRQSRSGSKDRTVSSHVQSCRLRLDAFLGEWLSPDYFDQITPPPGSVAMLETAKSELLRPAEYIDPISDTSGKSASGYFPGGWTGSAGSNPNVDGENGNNSPNLSATTGKNRSNTADSNPLSGNIAEPMRLSKIKTDETSENEAYVPPTPPYAISPSGPIPSGYVSHARDACVEFDYNWNSMREPHDWGNGGEYGEEWSSMHNRFRTGIRRMVDWYESHDTRGETSEKDMDDDDDDDTDTVLVLVTHGAGCNALIGALTAQPVLVDVGTASLTIAVRNDGVASPEENEGSRDLEHGYDVKIVASTEHLRSGGGLSRSPSVQSPRVLPSPISSYRHRFDSTLSNVPRDGFSLGDSVTTRFNQKASNIPSRSTSINRSSPGLWGSVPNSDNNSECADDLVPNFGDPTPPSASGSRERSKVREPTFKSQVPERSSSQRSQHGLWGSATGSGQDSGVKRRWTVTDRNA